jgi:[FeFe] hydrogenase (group B1/B3)
MRGIYTPVTKIRRRVFAEIAKMAYSGEDLSYIEQLPYKIIPGEVAKYRDSIFKERAIVGERIRLAMGLGLRPVGEHQPLANGVEDCAKPEIFYEPPLINVIPFACNACPTTTVEVTNKCRGCFAHPCVSVCPVKAISMVDGKSYIDQDKCIKCGRCTDICPYHAIVKYDRPCAAACGVDAIGSDELGRAKIDHEKCVSCGQCLVSCPFAAIADKSEIFQLIMAIREGNEVIAEIAPAFVGQFGPLATPEKVFEGLKELGFSDVYEVAIGADLGAVEEAHHFAHKVATGEQKFLATSCCPSWSVMAKTWFPEVAECVSDALTPMVATARIIKKEHPNAKVVFIGPCAAKKLEAQRRTVKSDVDFVITFEELMGMFVAKDIEFGDMEPETEPEQATGAGRGYACAGGVADAISNAVKELYPDIDFKVDRAEGLRECRKMMTLAKAGKRDGYLLEGMACPGGCVAGAGTILPIKKAEGSVKLFQKQAASQSATDSPYLDK